MYQRKILKTVRKVLPAVVSIVSQKHLSNFKKQPHVLYSFLPGHDAANRKEHMGPLVSTGSGSGFIVDKNGLILTNKHVLGDAQTEYTVILNDGRELPAEILSIDPINDVAILKIKTKKLPVLDLGDVRYAELGESVLAVGNALGVFKNTVSLGIISGLSRTVSAKENGDSEIHELRGLIQTDAAINPGNSGGPLVNLKGGVVGINVATISNAQNIGFAIPINAARKDLNDIKRYGRIRRPYLGIRYLIIDKLLQQKMGLSVDYGAYLIPEHLGAEAVIKGSPAEVAGLKERDIILQCSGKKITKDLILEEIMSNSSVGKILKLDVLRGGKKFAVQIKPSER